MQSYNRPTTSELTSYDHENTAGPSFSPFTINEPSCTTRVTELAISICKLNWVMVAPPLPPNTILGSNRINPALDSSLRSSADAHSMASGTILIVFAEIQPESRQVRYVILWFESTGDHWHVYQGPCLPAASDMALRPHGWYCCASISAWVLAMRLCISNVSPAFRFSGRCCAHSYRLQD
jgi:hypothetical protein